MQDFGSLDYVYCGILSCERWRREKDIGFDENCMETFAVVEHWVAYVLMGGYADCVKVF